MNAHVAVERQAGCVTLPPFWHNWDTVEAAPGQWIVKGAIPRVGVGMVVGSTMAGKTFFVLELMSSIALGASVLGRRTHQCGVAYIAAEGGAGLFKRVQGLRNFKNGDWDSHCRIVTQAFNLADEASFKAMADSLRQVRAEMHAQQIRLGVVVIDTLSASIPGVDENLAKEMSPVFDRLQRLAQQMELCVVLVAHHGKNVSLGPRGWSGQLANSDFALTISGPDQDSLRTVSITKVKDGDPGPDLAFQLEQVVLGQDEDGDQIDTCVIRWEGVKRPRKSRADALTASQNIILRALKRMTDNGPSQQIHAPGVPGGTFGVELKSLRDTAYQDGLSGEIPVDAYEVKKFSDRRRKAFENSIDKLQSAGYLRSEGGYVWLTSKPDGKKGN